MHVAMGFLGYRAHHPDYYAQAMLSIILGGNMSSRLFNEVREKHGLAYSISAGIKSLSDTGALMIRAGVDNAKIVAAIRLILKVLASTHKINKGEFQRTKDYFKGQFLLSLEDTMEHMLWVGSEVLSGDHIKSSHDVIAKIDAVSMDDVVRVAKDILAPHKLNLALIGPLDGKGEKQLKTIIDKGVFIL